MRRNGFKLKRGKFRLAIRKTFYCESGEAAAQVTQRNCGCLLPGSVQGKVGWGFDQHGLVEGVPCTQQGVWKLRFLRFFPTQTIL